MTKIVNWEGLVYFRSRLVNCQFFYRVKLYLCLKADPTASEGCEGLLSVVVIKLCAVEKRSRKRGQSTLQRRSPFPSTVFASAAQAHQHQSWTMMHFHKCVTYVGNGMPKSPAISVRDIHSDWASATTKYFVQNGIIWNAPMHIFPSYGIDKLLS